MNNTFFLFFATLICWGPTWYVIKFQLGVVDPMVSVFYRFFLASIMLLVFCKIKNFRLNFNLREHFIIFVLGVLLFNINYVIFYFSTEYLISAFVALCFSSILFMNVLNNYFLLRIKPNTKTLIGGCIGTFGLLIIFYEEVLSFKISKGSSYGLLLGIIATYFASLGNLASEKASKMNIDVVPATGLGMLYGSLSLLIYLVLTGHEFIFQSTFSYMSSLMYLSIFGSVLGFSFYLSLIKKIGSNDAAYVAIAMPLVALIVSTIFEQLIWEISLFIGAILIILGNFMILRSK